MNARNHAIRLSVVALAVGLAACGESDPGEVATGDEYLESVPSSSQLALTMDDGAVEEAPEEAGDPPNIPSKVRAATQKVLDRVNAVISTTQDRLHDVADGVEPETKTIGGFECKRWTKAGEAIEWRLTSCKMDRQTRKRGFKLEGRPLAADGADPSFLTVAAGHGMRLPRFDGKKRGHGRIGYNLDNLNELTGEGPTGKVGIGFRAVGKLRRLNVALRDFERAGETPISALYTYRHLLGEGGQVKLRARADLVTRDADGSLVRGQDEVVEGARIVVAWRRGVGARAALTLCGGTVGEGECVHLKHCWARNADASFDALGDGASYEPAACPEPTFDAEEAPAEDELEVPDADGNIPGPAVDEPAAE